MMTSRWRTILGCVLWSSSLMWPVLAAEPKAPAGSDRVEELMVRHNLHPAFEKLGRGASNALLGFAEVPLNIHQRYSRHDTGGSFLTGTAIGLFKGVVRTGVGIYEVVTFWLPYPEDFAPILPTLEYFKRDTSRRQPLPLE